MVGVGGGFSHIDWVGVVVGGVKTSFCTSLVLIRVIFRSKQDWVALVSQPF